MLHAGVMIDADRRDDDFFPRAGGRYIASVTAFHGIADFRDDFTRADVDLRQYFAVPGTTNHAIAIRGQFAFSGGAGDSDVPFYMLPRLGGSSTLRAYETSRFTDQSRDGVRGRIPLSDDAEAAARGLRRRRPGRAARERVRLPHASRRRTARASAIASRMSAVVRVDFARGQEGNRWIVGFSPGF